MVESIEEIRRRKMQELMKVMEAKERAQASGQSPEAAMEEKMREEAIERQIRLILQRILEPEARERLANVRIAKPDLAKQVELLLIQLYQAGRIQDKITEAQLITLLKALSSGKKDWKIKRK